MITYLDDNWVVTYPVPHILNFSQTQSFNPQFD